MGKLDDKVALVAGGTGTVGEGVVRAILKEGATVVVPSRAAEAIEKLRGYLGDVDGNRLVSIVGNIGEIEGAEKIRDEVLSRFGRLDAVVASLGGSWEEALTLTEVSIETWQRYLESNLTSHFVAARTFLPVLAAKKRGSYTLIGGASADLPVPRYSVVAIPSAGQLMMARILIEEMKGSGVRINQVIFGMVNTRARAAYAKPNWITADEVGEVCAWL
ncbi:MAG: dehydrogenase, partial [Cyanobacteria bacterium 13_1_20CM_4_61_6]